eukprot:COSAG06_NODE_5389_length_3510_cov_7.558780_2_plen_81_part_00
MSRQARDKHMKVEKERRFLQTAMETGKVKGAKSEVVKWEQIEEQRKDIGHVAEVRKRIYLLRCHFMLKNDHFTKTGSGQT